MIGFIIYESLEMSYTILKIAYNTTYGIYSWYYPTENDEKWQKIDIIEKRELDNQNTIKALEYKIQELENLVEKKKN
tara:strand:- start:20 stop:250 length:231 start_codon:yes stop_codon:yes gene_type:complete